MQFILVIAAIAYVYYFIYYNCCAFVLGDTNILIAGALDTVMISPFIEGFVSRIVKGLFSKVPCINTKELPDGVSYGLPDGAHYGLHYVSCIKRFTEVSLSNDQEWISFSGM